MRATGNGSRLPVTRGTVATAGGDHRVAPQAGPKYGDVEDSDYVHDEIRELGVIAREGARQLVGRAQDEEALFQQLQLSGPSKESVTMLRKEKEAAKTAAQTGIYVTYRKEASTSAMVRHGSRGDESDNECIRVGPTHQCFCSHTLMEHQSAKVNSKNGRINHPKCTLCNCLGFKYIPNQPEEVGDGHLSSRKGFVLSQWSPKCRGCGHGSKAHDPSQHSHRCTAAGCRCPGFQSGFACVVCDSFWEDHETAFEIRKDRMQEGRTVDADYVPLAQVPGVFSEMVFGENTSTAQRQTLQPGTGGRKQLTQHSTPAPPQTQSIAGDSVLPPYCDFCAAVIRDPKAKFCSQCGGRRI